MSAAAGERPRRRVIGMGNPWRGDDAAGLHAARRARDLAPSAVEVLEVEGEPVELLEAWEGAEAAVVLDAVSSGREPGHLHRVDAHAGPLPDALGKSSTHTLGLADAVELGRVLERLPRRLVVVGIEGELFEAGAGLTPAVDAAIDSAVAAALAELDVAARSQTVR